MSDRAASPVPSTRPIRRFLRDLLPAPLRESYHRWALKRDFGIVSTRGERRPFPLDPQLPIGVNLIGYFDSPSGIGESARALARAAEAVGLPVARREARELETGATIGAPFAINIFHVNADAAAAAVELGGPRVYRGRANVGYWYWETETFPSRWRDRFDYFDEIWVASEFCRRAIDPVSPIPVALVPPAVAPEVDEVSAAPRPGFRFLTISDAKSVPERKNPVGAVRAFRRAFSGSPAVSLTVKLSNAESASGLVNALNEAAGTADVRIDAEPVERKAVERQIAQHDGYVSLHRSEGFGLPIAEAMALGKPVVVTDYSGSRDFVDEETGFPVRWKAVATPEALGPYDAGTRWAEPDEDHAAELLARVVADPAEARRRAEAGRIRVRALYGLAPAGARLASRIELLRARLAARP